MELRQYRILIVEDETLLRKSIARKIQRFSNRFHVATAANGSEAMDRMAEFKPDIVFTDIMMPVMDGLCFIQKAMEAGYRSQFVILSGYSEFQYAKQAMEYGVRNYLLKPLSDRILYELLLKIVGELDVQDRASDHNSINLFLNTLPGEDLRASDSAQHSVMAAIIFLGNYISTLKMTGAMDEAFTHRWGNIDLARTAARVAGDMALPIPMLYHSAYCNERFLVFPDQYISGEQFAGFLEGMLRLLNDAETGVPLSAACLTAPVELKNLFNAMRSLRYQAGQRHRPWRTCLHRWVEEENTINRSVGAVQYNALLQHFQAGKPGLARGELDRLLRAWEGQGVCIEQYYQNLHLLILSLRRDIPCLYTGEWAQLEEEIHLRLALSRDLPDFSARLFELLEQSFFQTEEAATADTMEVIKTYIDENYSQDIGLLEIAERFHMSHSYLSRQFKQTYGQSPINYLITLRIERACTLLAQYPELESREIGQMVGYSDQYYFSKLFKKYKGVSPSEYRKQIV